MSATTTDARKRRAEGLALLAAHKPDPVLVTDHRDYAPKHCACPRCLSGAPHMSAAVSA